jgi:hypothetical protein
LTLAELTYNEQILRAMVRHQVGLLQVAGGIRNDVWAILDKTEADLRSKIDSMLRGVVGKTSTPARLAKVDKLLSSLRETRLNAWTDVNEVWFDRMRELSTTEASLTAGLIQGPVPVDLGLALPDVTRLRSIVTAQPFLGATLKEWADGIAEADVARIQQQIQIGLTQGEDVKQIARRVVGTVSKRGADGVTAISRRHAESLTRTATMSVAASARRELYAANNDLMSGELFTATLDSRTTPICRSLDGRIFEVGKSPTLPLHWGERSVLSPVIDGEIVGDRPTRNFTERQLLDEFAAKKGIKAPGKRDSLPTGTKGEYDAFRRKRMRELTGTAPAKLSYEEWLRGQPAKFQDEILGPARGKLFREQGLPLTKFVTPQGRELTLAELAKDDAVSIASIGMPPSVFTTNKIPSDAPLPAPKKKAPAKPKPKPKPKPTTQRITQPELPAAAEAFPQPLLTMPPLSAAGQKAFDKAQAQAAKRAAAKAKAIAKAEKEAKAAAAAQLKAEKAAKALAAKEAKAAKAAAAQAAKEAKDAAQKAANAALDPNVPLNADAMTKVSGQLGSNPGGIYRDSTGAEWYVKEARSSDHLSNELLAASLYREAGVEVINIRKATLGGKPAVASRIGKIETVKGDLTKAGALQDAARQGFATDAWLANWDAVGLDFDNLAKLDGKLTRLDVGGALSYRAQGKTKGALFGDVVNEVDTLRGIGASNPSAKAVFGLMTDGEVIKNIESMLAKTSNLTRDRIVELAKKAGFSFQVASDYATKLLRRREDLSQRIAILQQRIDNAAAAKAAAKSSVGRNYAEPPDVSGIKSAGSFPIGSKEYKDAYAKWKDSLASTEWEALRYWQGSGFQSIVRLERSGSATASTAASQNRDALYRAMARAPKVDSIELFRGIALTDKSMAGLAELGIIEGKEFSLPATSSFSRDRDIASNFGSVLFTVKKTNSFDISAMGMSHSSELEHVLPKGTKFRVDRIEQKSGRVIIHLSEIT